MLYHYGLRVWLSKKAFVAVDVLFARIKPLSQYILHLITYVIFMVPFAFVLVPESWGFFIRSFLSGERGYSVWAPPAWPVKLALFLGLTLLSLQGISEMLKQVTGISDALQARSAAKKGGDAA